MVSGVLKSCETLAINFRTSARGYLYVSVLDEAGEKGYAFAEVDLNEPIWCPWLACGASAEPNPTYLMERRPELYTDLCIPVEY